MNEANGYTIFCDDIRQEVGSKSSLMGMYGHEMRIHQELPVTMTKMGFHIVYWEDVNAPLVDLTLWILLPGDPDDKPTYKVEVERSEAAPPPLSSDADASVRRTTALNVVLNNLPIKQEGKIKVRMIVAGREVKLGTLAVKQQKSEALEAPSQ